MIYEFYVHVIFHPRNSKIDQGDLYEIVSQWITVVLFLKLIP
jgi:hypothetical protein